MVRMAKGRVWVSAASVLALAGLVGLFSGCGDSSSNEEAKVTITSVEGDEGDEIRNEIIVRGTNFEPLDEIEICDAATGVRRDPVPANGILGTTYDDPQTLRLGVDASKFVTGETKTIVSRKGVPKAIKAVTYLEGSGGTVDSVVAGAGMAVDATAPANPIASVNVHADGGLDNDLDGAGELGLIDGTTDDQVLKWTAAGGWELAADETGAGGGRVDSIVAGSGIAVDSGDPVNPTVSLIDGTAADEILMWNGSVWTLVDGSNWDTDNTDDLTTTTAFGGDVSGTYDAIQIAADAVGSAEIADGSIASADIGTGQVTGTHIADGTITGTDITDGTITGTDIAGNSIEGSDIVDNTVTSTDIADGTITNIDISGFAAIAPSKISGTAWTSTNDGAGSGLDADTVDGSHAADFVRKAGDTMTGMLMVDTTDQYSVNVDNDSTAAAPTWGVYARADGAAAGETRFGVQGVASGGGTNYGVHGTAPVGTGYAVYANGDLHVTGAISTSATTRYYTIGAGGFIPYSSVSNYSIQPYYYYGTSSGQFHRVHAAVNLPNGAVITDFAACFDDNDNMQGISVTLERVTWGMSGVSAIATCSTTAAETPGTVTRTVTGLTHTVDNDARSYNMRATWLAPTTPDDIRLRSVKVTYDITSPLP